jgi:hypothetical protein
MKFILMIAAVLLSLSACAQLPKIQMPTASDALPSHLECRALFPQGRWQLHHAIEVFPPGGGKTLLTGVTIISSRNRSIDFALMSVEGFVIFSGRFKSDLTVDRAISPFDRPGFAQGLMDDLRLLFFAPQGPLCMTGQLAEQNRICRYCSPEKTTDIIVSTHPTWQIRQYSSRKRLSRSIDADNIVNIANTAFAQQLTLKKRGLLGYQLVLKLLEAIPLNDERNEQ